MLTPADGQLARGQRIGQGSFDALASPINQMFNLTAIRISGFLILSPSSGEPIP